VTLPAHPYAHPKTTTILPSLKTMSKISSVTVFTEVVAMISSFHRNSEKEKKNTIERKITRTYNCSKRNNQKIESSPKAL
jgi:hypothetical protein